MTTLVQIVQVSDGSWYLQIVSIDESDVTIVNTLIPFERYIFAFHAAQSLQLHVDKVVRNDQFDQAI